MKRVSEAIDQLSKRVGFRVISGLSERVVYREMFPQGLTMLDSREFGDMGIKPRRRAAGAARDDVGARAARARDAAVRLT